MAPLAMAEVSQLAGQPSRNGVGLDDRRMAAARAPAFLRRELEGQLERGRLWRRWVAVDPNVDGYAGRRSTETPVIVLEPRDGTA